MEERAGPNYLYKIVSKEQWHQSNQDGYVVPSELDKDFIHLATKEQVGQVIKKFWENKSYLVVKVAVDELLGKLHYETNPGGTTKYYHLYNGRIPLIAVSEVSYKFENVGSIGESRD